MTKQEAIKQAYGKYYNECKPDENGWTEEYNCKFFECLDLFKDIEHLNFEMSNKIRPISLKGIEDNNGWIKIESKDDLPKEDYTLCHYIVNGKTEIGEYLKLHFDRPKQNELYHYKSVTHYQPIHKSQPPIY